MQAESSYTFLIVDEIGGEPEGVFVDILDPYRGYNRWIAYLDITYTFDDTDDFYVSYMAFSDGEYIKLP